MVVARFWQARTAIILIFPGGGWPTVLFHRPALALAPPCRADRAARVARGDAG